MARVFISNHGRHDGLASEIAEALKKAGHSVWWYQKSLRPGDFPWEKIGAEIESSDKYVILYSLFYKESRQCSVEKNAIIEQCLQSQPPKGLMIVRADGIGIQDIETLMRPMWCPIVSSKNEISEYIAVARRVVEEIDSCVFLPSKVSLASSLEVFTESQSLEGFKLLLDSMIVDAAADLLFPQQETYETRRRCRDFYLRSLEDFAFATVYGSRVITSETFRPKLSAPSEPGVKLVGLLGELYEPYKPDEKILKGALLNDARSREWIAADIRSLGKSLTDVVTLPFFGGWMIRESQKHLGIHPSLFRDDLPPEKYEFDVSKERLYYEDRVLQGVLDDTALDILVGYLPKAPVPGADAYALPALKEFASRNALSLITNMWEYDLSARQQKAARLPHAVRAIVTQRSVDSAAPQQALLRDIVVRAPLLTALQRIGPGNKPSLVTALLDLRDAQPFKEMREVLEHEDLLVMEPTWVVEPPSEKTGSLSRKRREQRAERVLKLISGSTTLAPEQQDRFLLARRAALRRLGRLPASTYESEVFRIFPELAIATSGPRTVQS